jgi:hypothetical protein
VRKKAEEINALFDAVRLRCNLSERAVFDRAYPFQRERAESLFWDFVRNVPGCPPDVLTCAEQLLAEVHKNDIRV